MEMIGEKDQKVKLVEFAAVEKRLIQRDETIEKRISVIDKRDSEAQKRDQDIMKREENSLKCGLRSYSEYELDRNGCLAGLR